MYDTYDTFDTYDTDDNVGDYKMENIDGVTKAKTPRGLALLWKKIRYSQTLFIIVYCIAGMHILSLWGYLPSILTTLEKRFGFSTQAVTFMFVISDISTFIFSIILTYYGGNKHRPRMVAIGLIFWSTAMILIVSPQLIYGPKELSESIYDKDFNSSSLTNSFELSCERARNETCGKDSSTVNTSSIISLCLMSIGIFISNAGFVVCITIGLSYVDDNIDKQNAGLYIGLFSVARQIGLIGGIFYASKFLSLYQKPSVDPGFDEKDPRWIGACSDLKGSNKSHLTHKDKDFAEAKGIKDENLWKDLPSRIKKLCQNKVYVANMFSVSFGLFSKYGSALMIPKILEVMFFLTPSEANTYNGYINIASSVVGFLVVGVLTKVFKPSPVKIAIFLTVSFILNAALIFSVNGITCGNPEIKKEIMASEPQCAQSCNCDNFQFNPICDVDRGITYFSPCHANCKEHHIESGTMIYRQCGCNVTEFEDGSLLSLSLEFNNAQNGVCHQKSFIPAPILFGMVIDKSCNIWDESNCESNTFCIKYDYERFRDSIHIFIGAGYIFAAGFAAYMTFHIRKIKDFYSDED
ncbi:Solute carrier organic anion transporter family member 2B1 [Nymphon striatum]|nr:Solute carrier organic anion transporter family member 2B1 [Nymphon striatum]